MVSSLGDENSFDLTSDSVTPPIGTPEMTNPVSDIVVMKHLKCVTLQEDNNFSWKTQFSALLRRHKLLDYVDGKILITEGSTILTTKQQIQLILS